MALSIFDDKAKQPTKQMLAKALGRQYDLWKEIAEYVWQNQTDSTNIVDVYVNFLRKKIESVTNMKYIHTVRGTGYVLREEDEKG